VFLARNDTYNGNAGEGADLLKWLHKNTRRIDGNGPFHLGAAMAADEGEKQ
jgi:hypothetical protein